MLALVLAVTVSASPFETVAERTRYVQSGRYDEVIRICKAAAERFPTKAQCEVFGTTPEGRPIHVLILGEGTLNNRPVVLVQGGIHAGEIDGKDAALALARDLLDDKVLPGILQRLTFVLVPVYNVDGHENVAPDNRPNQIGPQTPGFRVTAQRLNLNRDYAKADAPETRAMLALLRRWDPLVYVDLHTTDGMDFEPDVALLVEPRLGWPSTMRTAGQAFSDAMMKKLTATGHLPLDFYPSASDETNPLSGWANNVAPPRFSVSYWQQWGRFSILVETHALKPNAQRVKASRDAVVGILEYVRDNSQALVAAARDSQTSIAGAPVHLSFQPTATATPMDFRGVAYEILPSTITGKSWVRFDPKKPKIWKTSLQKDVAPSLTVKAPRGGYVVPPEWVPVVLPLLEAHGLRSSAVTKPVAKVAREVFKPMTIAVAPQTTEGRTRVTLEGDWLRDSGDVAAGSLFVPIDQRGGALLMHLLEPCGPDSMAAWGFFNVIFESREYVELMVLEPFAQKLLAGDAAAKKDFDALVARGATEAERVDFFYRRHPSNDRRRDLYPVVRVDMALQ